MTIESKYNLGDRILLQNGAVKTVKGIHIYVSDKKIGCQIHIGDGKYISQKRYCVGS